MGKKRNPRMMKATAKKVKAQVKDSELVRKKHLQIALGAAKLFIKKGFGQTSMREISKATGITIGSLYDYITKKEDILYLVFDVFHSTWINSLMEKGILKIEDPIEQLRTAFRQMQELVGVYREMVLLMYAESKSLPKGFLKVTLAEERGLIEFFEEILKRGVRRKVFQVDDTFFMANVIVYLISLAPLRGWNLRQYSPAQITQMLESMIWQGIQKKKTR